VRMTYDLLIKGGYGLVPVHAPRAGVPHPSPHWGAHPGGWLPARA
jgi:hypothetical protein